MNRLGADTGWPRGLSSELCRTCQDDFAGIDCLKRPPAKFHNPLTKKGEYDKLIWAVAILLSLYFYFIGPVAYFFVVKRGKPEKTQ